MKTSSIKCGPWLMFAAALASATAVVAVLLAVRACNVCEDWQASCTRLQEENVQLRQALAACAGKTENLIITVKNADSPKTLAQKNRNFTNLKALPNDTWKGQIGTDRFGHAIFESPAWSIRATAITLRTYEKKYNIKTVEGIVLRFSETNHTAYIKHICSELHLKKNEEFSISARLPELLRAMVLFESGERIGEDLLALVEVR